MTPYYEDARVRLFHCDCRDLLPTLPAGSVDLVLTDPPFGVRDDRWDRFEDDFAFAYFTGTWLALSARASKTVACFFPDKSLPLLMDEARRRGLSYRRSLIWKKPPGSQMAGASLDGFWFDFEAIYVFGQGAANAASVPQFSVLEHRTVTGQRHGCQKPQDLLAEIISGYCPESGVVLDPFAGSGTTLRAAKDLGRKSIGIEIEERYCEIAANRLSQGVLDYGDRA